MEVKHLAPGSMQNNLLLLFFMAVRAYLELFYLTALCWSRLSTNQSPVPTLVDF